MIKRLLLVFIVLVSVLSIAAQELTVGSYNIRYQNSDDSICGNGWVARCAPICNQIKWERPDIFGVQEALNGQLKDMSALLPAYRWTGVGRDDGKTHGEYAAIFYNSQRIELLEEGHFWLNDTPDRPVLGWDAACVRICSWGHFRIKDSGRDFYFMNLHMDHVGVKARRESAKLVMQRITEMTDGGKKLAVLTGDFNAPQTNELYGLFTQSGVLKDCYTSAEWRFAENGTYNGFDYHYWTDERIDHIFVTPATTVCAYAIRTDGRWQEDMNYRMSRCNLSDHYPVFARIKF